VTNSPPALPSVTSPGAGSAGSGPLAALRIAGYRRWFVTQVLSASGNLTQTVAISWIVLQDNGSGVDLAWVTAAALLPVLLLGAPAGIVSDRFSRRHVLIGTQLAFSFLGALLFVLTLAHHDGFQVLLGVSVLSGIVFAVDSPARQLYAGDLVGRANLSSAVGLFEVVMNASRIVGPSAAGALLAVAGPAWCFLANALAFLPPLVVLLTNRPTAMAGRTAAEQGRAVERDSGRLRDGLRYALSTPAIRACLLLAAISGVLFNSALLLPLLAVKTFHLGAGGVGALIASFGVGALPGALAAARGREPPTGRLILRLAILTGLATILVAGAPDATVAFALMVVTGFVSIWFIAAANTFVQLVAPPHLRGRVMGVWTMALPGMNPVTGFGAGLLADAAGARIAYGAAGALFLLGAVGGWRALRSARSEPVAAVVPPVATANSLAEPIEPTEHVDPVPQRALADLSR
jgi:MFS family permease